MKIQFHKYQGAGNDFVMIDNREGQFDKSNLLLIQQLCDRRFGVGSDGLILIENHDSLDFNMIYYNSDGSQSFCGNGSRCAIAFTNRLGMISKNTSFNSTDGEHEGVFATEKEIHLNMHDVADVEKGENFFYMNTGSPHYIKYVDDVDAVDILKEAHQIRYNNRFKEEGVNVNFVQILSNDKLKIRTYERGVENETLACGTGVTAAAISFMVQSNGAETIEVEAKGGLLTVKLEKEGNEFKNIWLIGAGEMVFEGEVNV